MPPLPIRNTIAWKVLLFNTFLRDQVNIMAWYYGTYACGHEGRVNVIGPTKDREWKVNHHFEKLCPECYEKWQQEERERKSIEAQKETETLELPELEGTEKQVSWAITLRVDLLKWVEKTLSDYARYNRTLRWRAHDDRIVSFKIEEAKLAIDLLCKSETSAKFWIDHRADVTEVIIIALRRYRKQKLEEQIPEEVRKEAEEIEESLTVKPENSTKDGVVRLEQSRDGNLSAIYVKDDDFREIVKEKGFSWNGERWEKIINEYSGTITERAADLGNTLLAKGFTVKFLNEESKIKALNGDFSDEQTRWVKYSSREKCLTITWKGFNGTLYSAAKKIPGARWSNGRMEVSTEFYKEVQDFAETMGFGVSQKAMQAIEEYKEQEANYEISKVTEKVREDLSDDTKLRKKLVSGGTILEDLLDDET